MNNNDLWLDPEQEAMVKAIKDPTTTIVFCNAKAGTGKTTVAMWAANQLVKDRFKEYDGIVYIVSPYGEGKQGFLPGSITEKSEVYYEPAYQAIAECGLIPYEVISTESLSDKKKGKGYIKLLTHTYLRGTNLQKKIVILDEAQNYTVAELKKVLTRIHDDCKAIVIGHTGQIDITGKSGFDKYLKHFEKHPRCKVCELHTNHRGWLASYADEMEG